MLLWNGKRRLKRIVCHHAVGVEIAEVEPAACLVPGAHGGDAVAWVGVEPAVGRNVEARPVMTAAEVRLGGQTALPLSGNKWKKARKSLFARLSGSFNDSRDAVMTLKSGF